MKKTTAKDISGQRFGALTAIARCGTQIRANGKKRALWRFACDCGGVVDRPICKVSRAMVSGCGKCISTRAADRAKICPPPIKQAENVIGQIFGGLTAVSHIGNGKWLCSCECGGETIRRLCDLRTNLKRGCRSGCGRCRIYVGHNLGKKINDPNKNRPKLNLAGEKFGSLEVISLFARTRGGSIWECVCDCGSDGTVKRSTGQLRKVRHPGCKDCESDRRASAKIIHGGAAFGGSRLYATWKAMRGRCADLENPHYGGKGIRVCQEWEDFPNFRRWALGAGYSDVLTIDRLDPSKGYFPRNCEWVTPEENSRRVHAPKMRAA